MEYTIPSGDKALIEDRYRYFRGERRGDVLPELYFHMIGVGLRERVDESDIPLLKAYMGKLRKNESLNLIETLYFLKEILPPFEAAGKSALPPLKKFV